MHSSSTPNGKTHKGDEGRKAQPEKFCRKLKTSFETGNPPLFSLLSIPCRCTTCTHGDVDTCLQPWFSLWVTTLTNQNSCIVRYAIKSLWKMCESRTSVFALGLLHSMRATHWSGVSGCNGSRGPASAARTAAWRGGLPAG